MSGEQEGGASSPFEGWRDVVLPLLRRVPPAAWWFLLPLPAYLWTMCGSFLPDDSPEVVNGMATLEFLHPPGYPLLVLLGRLFMLVPAGGAGFRASLLAAALAALAGALAGTVSHRLAERAGLGRVPALAAGTLAAAMLDFGWVFWDQALSAKGAVYGLNACLLGAFLLSVMDMEAPPPDRPRAGLKAALLAGAGLANHWMSAVVVIPVAAWWAWRKGGPGIRRLALAGFLGAAGLTAYLLLPVRAESGVMLNWGRPSTFGRLLDVVTREHYRDIELGARPPGYASERIAHLGVTVWREWTPLLLLAGIAGIALLALHRRRELVLLLGTGGTVTLAVLLMAAPPPGRPWITEPYLVPVIMMWAVLSGLAAGWLAEIAGDGTPARRAVRWALPAVSVLLLVAASGGAHSRSRDYVSYDYGWNLLECSPSHSVIFCESDFDLFSLMCHLGTDERRPDAAVAAAVFLDYEWYRETAHEQLPEVIPREHRLLEYVIRPGRPLVYTPQHPGGTDVLKPVGLVLRPPIGQGTGLVDSAAAWRVLRYRGLWEASERRPRAAAPLISSYAMQMTRMAMEARTSDPLLAILAFRKAIRLPQEVVERVRVRYNFAQYMLQTRPQERALAERMVEAARLQLEAVLVEAPAYYRAHILLGNISYMRGDIQGAGEHLRQALSLMPLAGTDTERQRIGRLLETLK